MEFRKGHDTTDTTDFYPHQLVTDLLRGNWCNGFWPLLCMVLDLRVIQGHCCHVYRVVQKTVPQFYFCDNFRKCTPIFTIFSLLEQEIHAA